MGAHLPSASHLPRCHGGFLFPVEFSGRHASDLGHLCLLPTAQSPSVHHSPNCHFGGLAPGPPPHPTPGLASAFIATSHLPLCTPIPPSPSATWKCPELPDPGHGVLPSPGTHHPTCGQGQLKRAPRTLLLRTVLLSLPPTRFTPARATGTELPNSLGHGADLASKRLSFWKPMSASRSFIPPHFLNLKIRGHAAHKFLAFFSVTCTPVVALCH